MTLARGCRCPDGLRSCRQLLRDHGVELADDFGARGPVRETLEPFEVLQGSVLKDVQRVGQQLARCNSSVLVLGVHLVKVNQEIIYGVGRASLKVTERSQFFDFFRSPKKIGDIVVNTPRSDKKFGENDGGANCQPTIL